MKRVVIESPLRGAVPEWVTRWLPMFEPLVERIGRELNRRYACRCMRDSLARGEAPYASHLLYDQRGILDDAKPSERERGIRSGFAWTSAGALTAVYVDRGIRDGMLRGVLDAHRCGRAVVFRTLNTAGRTISDASSPWRGTRVYGSLEGLDWRAIDRARSARFGGIS